MARRGLHRAPFGPPPAAKGAIIPYDYGATFAITGRPGSIVQDAITISPDGVFVAVAIGYGFEEQRGRPLGVALPPVIEGAPISTLVPANITLGQIPTSALIEGFRANPRFEPLVFKTPGQFNGERIRSRLFADEPIPADQFTDEARSTVLERVKAPEEISFLFSIVDTSTGRELQDEPTHNLASLGRSNGERPFRLLAQPITFMPRSTIRLQVIERTEGATGTLFIVLYGYKILGSSACPETVARTLTGPPQCRVESIGRPSDRVIPFDYVTTIDLTGRPKNLVENETTVSVEGGFVATAVGYGLLVEEGPVIVQKPPGNQGNLTNLAEVKLRQFPPSALMDGIRIRPNLVRLAFDNNAQLNAQVPVQLLDELFERLNRPEDVSFRYTIFDGGRGRELQNQPLHNVAGLGIANGDRPFKRLARPMVFLPRSTIRIQVEERFGRGKVFFVFQGYKILGAPPTGGRA